MKKAISLLLSLAMIMSIMNVMGMSSFAAADVAINETNFPDANFRAYVKENCDTDKNGVLSGEEIENVTEVYVDEAGITSLKGIEYFTALTWLSCWNNKLTSLDVSKNTALEWLSCFDNQLTSLNVSKNTALEDLRCSFNKLTSLDVSKNTALDYLNCEENQLTSLDVSKNTALESLTCYGNQLTSLDVSKNTALTWLWCGNSKLTSLDVSKNTALETLICSESQLTSLDVSKNTALKHLDCDGNQLTSLDVSKNTALDTFYCSYNQFVINVGKNNTFDLSTLPGKFDVSKASKWEGGSVKGNILTVNKDAEEVTYTYNMGNGKTETFTLLTKAPKPDVKLGDVNGDNEIKIVDAKWILQSVAKIKTLNDVQKAAADLNNDGKVTIIDAKWVLQIVADLRDGATLKMK